MLIAEQREGRPPTFAMMSCVWARMNVSKRVFSTRKPEKEREKEKRKRRETNGIWRGRRCNDTIGVEGFH